MITRENRRPYDRPNLSKNYLQGDAEEEWMPLRSEDFYKKHDIEILLNKNVQSVDIAKKKIELDNDETISFDKLLIATGGVPRKLDVPGSNLNNIFYLRSFDDADKIIAAAEKSKKAVIVGSSFIGMETASSLRKRNLEITVVSPEKLPFEKKLGTDIGKLLKNLHEENGVKFELNTKVKMFEGDDRVETVTFENGNKIETDIVLIGIGVTPETSFIKDVESSETGALLTDKNFKVKDDIYACGDIAKFPYWRANNNNIRIEHWRTAEQEGRTAGFNMAGKKMEYHSIPFFWTVQAGLKLRYVGHAEDWEELIVWGEVASKKFIVFYIKDNAVIAAAGNNYDKEMAAIQQLMRLEKMPDVGDILNKSVNLVELVQT